MFLPGLFILISLTIVASQNTSNNDKIFIAEKCIAVPDLLIQNQTQSFNVVKIFQKLIQKVVLPR